MAFAGFVLLLLPVRYATNDDPGFIAAMTGGDGHPPENFALFNGFFLNTVLFRLYAAFPEVPWWGVLIYTALVLATSLLFSFMFRIGRAAWPVAPAVGYFLLLCYAHAGVTSATLLLVVSATLWLHRAALPDPPPGGSTAATVALAACLSLAVLMRWQAAAAFLVFGAAAWAAARPGARGRVAAVLLAACAVLAADRLVFGAVATPAQKRYLADNALRARFHDTPAGDYRAGTTEAAARAAGWTIGDYRFYRGWNLFDDSLFNPARLKTFLELNGEGAARSIPESVLANARGAKKNLAILALALLTLALVPRGRRPGTAWARLSPWVVPAATAAALAFFLHHRFVDRVSLPLAVLLLGAIAASRSGGSAPEGSARSGRTAARVVFGLQIAAVLFAATRFVPALYADRELLRFAESCHASLPHGTTVAAFLDPASGLGFERVSPLRERFAPDGPAMIPDGVWAGSPRLRRIFASRGRESGRDFLRAAPGDSGLVWVLWEAPDPRPEVRAAWRDYYRRNLGARIDFVPVRACADPRGGRLVYYRMKSAGAAPRPDATPAPSR